MTLWPTAEDFLAGYKPGTRARYTVEILRFQRWCAERDLTLRTVRRVHLETYRTHLSASGLAENTVSTYMGSVGMLFRYAYEEEIIPRNPAQNVRRGRRPRQATSAWLSRQQLIQLLHVCQERAAPDVNAGVHLLALNGIRINELLALRIDDVVDFAGRTCIRLHGRKYSPGGQHLSLSTPTIRAVEPLLAARTAGWLIRTPKRPGGPPPTRDDRARRDGARLRLVLRRFCEEEGLPVVTPHGLRHTFVTLARDAGVPDRDLMASTGHIDPRMLTYYDRAHAAVDRNATHQLSAWLNLDG